MFQISHERGTKLWQYTYITGILPVVIWADQPVVSTVECGALTGNTTTCDDCVEDCGDWRKELVAFTVHSNCWQGSLLLVSRPPGFPRAFPRIAVLTSRHKYSIQTLTFNRKSRGPSSYPPYLVVPAYTPNRVSIGSVSCL